MRPLMNWIKKQLKFRWSVVFWAWMLTYIVHGFAMVYVYGVEDNYHAMSNQLFGTIWMGLWLATYWALEKSRKNYRELLHALDELILKIAQTPNEKSNDK